MKRLDFFRPASEDKRVTALEPHYVPTEGAFTHQNPVDGLLRRLFPERKLADVDQLGRRRMFQDLRANQIIEYDNLCPLKRSQCADSQQVRVAGAGANQCYDACVLSTHFCAPTRSLPCNPHSVFVCPAQRPSRSPCRPSTGAVHGSQPRLR